MIARFYNNDIILAAPSTTLKTLHRLVQTSGFWVALAFSASRIVIGFFSALLIGTIFAFTASRFRTIAALLDPPLLLIRSTPIASLTILILLWVGSRNLSVIVSFMMVLPIVYLNTLSGIRTVDPKLREMATVFRLSFLKRLRFITLPTVFPFFRAAVSAGLGFCWKSGIAAEVIGISSQSIGEKLYLAKIYLNTGELFAWTFVIILIAFLFEKGILRLVEWVETSLTGIAPSRNQNEQGKE